MKLTKEQKAAAVEKLSTPWGHLTLLCDGYHINLQVQRAKNLTYRVMTYVNGEFKYAWVLSDKEAPEQKFLKKMVRPLHTASYKKKMEKIFGKRAVAKDPQYSRVHTSYMPDWASGKAAINHLCKVCESIHILEGESS